MTFIPNKYQNHHKILTVLDDLREELKIHGYHKIESIASKANLTLEEANKSLTFLSSTKPREVEFKTSFGYFRYRISVHGTLAKSFKKYHSEGKEKFKSETLRIIQMIGIVSTSIIGVSTLAWNIVRTSQNQNQIENITNQLQAEQASKQILLKKVDTLEKKHRSLEQNVQATSSSFPMNHKQKVHQN